MQPDDQRGEAEDAEQEQGVAGVPRPGALVAVPVQAVEQAQQAVAEQQRRRRRGDRT
ncbi:hypothetical protein ACQP26_05550 [Micromonospora sp. CA-248089]|uniref:hypothetical protein n=1 Tax=Micromonospora sp. CA-248089 TaxID=3239960 RepID=UPI003D8C196E